MISGRIYVTEDKILCGSRGGSGVQLYPVSAGESIPSGIITMWSGASNAIPAGWYLCDGNNNTPDLRNRFIVGAGSSYGVGNTGGSDTVTLNANQIPAHSHGFSLTAATNGSHSHGQALTASTAGSHTHTFAINQNCTATFRGSQYAYWQYPGSRIVVGDEEYANGTLDFNLNVSGTTGAGGGHTHSIVGSINSAGSHTHSVTGSISNTGGGQAHENRPPYYALCFIMKA